MPEFGIALPWWRHTNGYVVQRRKPAAKRDGRGPFEALVAKSQRAETEEFIVGRDGKLEQYDPLEAFDGMLYREFAKIDGADGALSFIGRFGPLTGLKGDCVTNVVGHARAMKRYLESYSGNRTNSLMAMLSPVGINLGRLDLALVPNRTTGRIEMRIVAENLLTGVWLQFGHAVARGAKIRKCDHCGALFEAGPGTGRRLDARFCSDDHRIAFNSLKRSGRG